MAEKFDYLIRESPMDWATEQAEEQFRTPINHSLIGTWGVLENCTELTIVNLTLVQKRKSENRRSIMFR